MIFLVYHMNTTSSSPFAPVMLIMKAVGIASLNQCLIVLVAQLPAEIVINCGRGLNWLRFFCCGGFLIKMIWRIHPAIGADILEKG